MPLVSPVAVMFISLERRLSLAKDQKNARFSPSSWSGLSDPLPTALVE